MCLSTVDESTTTPESTTQCCTAFQFPLRLYAVPRFRFPTGPNYGYVRTSLLRERTRSEGSYSKVTDDVNVVVP